MADGAEGSFLGGMSAGDGNPGATPPPGTTPPPAETLPNGAPDGQAAPPAATRPEWVHDKFWIADKGEVDTEKLAKSYTELERYVGGDKIPVPKDPDDKLAWEMYYRAGGVPETADAYEFQRRDDLPEGLPYDEEAEKAYRNWAHANHLNPQQAKALYESYVAHQVERYALWERDQKQAREQLEANFVRKHGAQAEAVKARVGSLMDRYADQDFRQYLTESGHGNDLRMVDFMDRIARDLNGVTGLKGAAAADAAAPRAPGEIQEKIAEFRRNNDKVLRNPDDPAHKIRVDQLMKLHEELVAARGPNVV